MAQKPTARLIYFPEITDQRGSLAFIEGDSHIPFKIERVFYIYGVPEGVERGGHVHKTCHQVLIPVSGRFSVAVSNSDRVNPWLYMMADQNEGLYIEPGVKVQMYNFSDDAVCLVLASEHYNEEEYVREVAVEGKIQRAEAEL